VPLKRGLPGIADPDVLDLAAAQDRILVSHDTSTMPLHFASFVNQGKQSPGLFLVAQQALVRDVIEVLILVWSASSPADWVNQIHHLPSLAKHAYKS
jgi:hypothetical protein